MPTKLQVLRARAFQRQGGLCCYCGVRMWLALPGELPDMPRSLAAAARLRCTAEHLQAQSAGGQDSAANIAAACAHCNHTRHKRRQPPDPVAFRQQVARRMKAGSWHQRWVHERGLAQPGLAASELTGYPPGDR